MTETVWFVIYNTIVVPLIWGTFHLLAAFNQKVRHGVRGRKILWRDLEKFLKSGAPAAEATILFHSASLGEYEQVRPILRKLKEKHPAWRLIVTFFSPSGYENFKKDAALDLAVYLPFDSLRSVQRFFNRLKPSVIVISKHDVWPNFIWTAERRRIPVLLINATLPKDSKISRWPGRLFYSQVYARLSGIFPASETDRKEFQKLAVPEKRLRVLGDTRFDQVLKRAEESRSGNFFPDAWRKTPFVFIAGSTWPSDEEHVLPALFEFSRKNPEGRFVVVPHEPTEHHVAELLAQFEARKIPVLLYSKWQKGAPAASYRFLLVDQIGVLANLYAYSHLAYVGGSFDPGVHNVMEPAASANAVLFGPRILNSPEAQELVRRGAGFVVHTSEEILTVLEELVGNPQKMEEARRIARQFVLENAGATDAIVREIESFVSP